MLRYHCFMNWLQRRHILSARVQFHLIVVLCKISCKAYFCSFQSPISGQIGWSGRCLERSSLATILLQFFFAEEKYRSKVDIEALASGWDIQIMFKMGVSMFIS